MDYNLLFHPNRTTQSLNFVPELGPSMLDRKWVLNQLARKCFDNEKFAALLKSWFLHLNQSDPLHILLLLNIFYHTYYNRLIYIPCERPEADVIIFHDSQDMFSRLFYLLKTSKLISKHQNHSFLQRHDIFDIHWCTCTCKYRIVKNEIRCNPSHKRPQSPFPTTGWWLF